jgi:hypothetical protein
MTTNNLTELWKKGELEEGWYYLKDNGIFIDYYNGCNFNDTSACEIKEVLAEVPDYIEWKNYVVGFCDEHEYNLKLLEENQQLKELLKECWQEIKPLWDKALCENPERMPYSDEFIRLDGLKTKINEVLNE